MWVDYLTKLPLLQFNNNKILRDEAYHIRLEQAPREVFIIKLPDKGFHAAMLTALLYLYLSNAKSQESRLKILSALT